MKYIKFKDKNIVMDEGVGSAFGEEEDEYEGVRYFLTVDGGYNPTANNFIEISFTKEELQHMLSEVLDTENNINTTGNNVKTTQVRMNINCGLFKIGEIYNIIAGYDNELNTCINAEQNQSSPCIPVIMDSREGKRCFEYIR